ncbi:MAG: tRNA 2-thiouridine(34) synthase MnmA [Candidatus Eisenbacteria bacterium]|nr:tRNA 2-thiouridine(34) synthase MnmA [Candidatus Latescibacterota bacterium]MBD3301367.1 tRNA 2-thiouridine(34) synthase MnmA [Candidatus Eisenbacteria bacterium]
MVGLPPTTRQRLRVLVAMSGGVDSAVAAHLLRAAGHEVAGATMKLFCYGDREGPPRPCCDLEAIRAARSSARRLGIPHTVVDVEEAFGRHVIGDFIDEYAGARTPNPCVRCNTDVKFGPLLDKAHRMGFDAIATGHYVRCEPIRGDEPDWGLFRAVDREKDQSYVLWGLDRRRLDRCLFPLGGVRKPVVRRLARRLGIPSWDRPESQDICFVPPGGHGAFLSERLPADHPMRRPGPIRHVDGERLGRHDGLLGFTIGQRKGTGTATGERLYVVRIDPSSATLWLGPRAATRCAGLVTEGGNLLAPPPLLEEDGVIARIRYRHAGAPCRVRILREGCWEVRFAQPQPAVAEGQSVVFYRQDRVIGGARIGKTVPASPEPSHDLQTARMDRSI